MQQRQRLPCVVLDGAQIEVDRTGRSEVHWRDHLGAADGAGRVLEQLPLPLHDQGGVQLELLGQLGQGLVLALGAQGDPGLELGGMHTPDALRRLLHHRKLLHARSTKARLHVRSFQLSRCSDLRGHFSVNTIENSVGGSFRKLLKNSQPIKEGTP